MRTIVVRCALLAVGAGEAARAHAVAVRLYCGRRIHKIGSATDSRQAAGNRAGGGSKGDSMPNRRQGTPNEHTAARVSAAQMGAGGKAGQRTKGQTRKLGQIARARLGNHAGAYRVARAVAVARVRRHAVLAVRVCGNGEHTTTVSA